MEIPFDYKELLKILNEHKVKYLVIGAYAVIYYTEPRFTKDLDILIEPSIENAKRIYEALKEFGAPLEKITADDFTKKSMVYQIGIAPVRVDILMGIKGADFNLIWKGKVKINIEGVAVNIIGLQELVKLKKLAKRDADKRDLKELKYVQKKKKK